MVRTANNEHTYTESPRWPNGQKESFPERRHVDLRSREAVFHGMRRGRRFALTTQPCFDFVGKLQVGQRMFACIICLPIDFGTHPSAPSSLSSGSIAAGAAHSETYL